jgi:hypothetical protein
LLCRVCYRLILGCNYSPNAHGIWNETASILFSGDSLFIGGCGKLFEGNPGDLYNMFQKLLEELDDSTYLLPGHEYSLDNLEFTKKLDPSHVAIELAYKNAQNCKSLNIPSIPGTWREELKINPYIITKLKKSTSLEAAILRESKAKGIHESLKKELRSFLPIDVPLDAYEEILLIGLIRKLKDSFVPTRK